MAYTEQVWADNDPTKPVSAARLQHIEDGLAAVANGGSSAPISDIRPYPRIVVPKNVAPTLVTSFQSGHGFTQSGTGTSGLNDTGDFVLGAQAAWIATAGGGVANALRKIGGTSVSFAGKDVVVWMKVDDWSVLGSGGMLLYMGDTSFTNFFLAAITETQFQTATNQVVKSGEWVRLVIPWASVTVGAGTPTRSAITDFQFRIVDNNTGTPLKLHVNGIGSVPDMSTKFPNGVVSITFDDGWASGVAGAGRAKMDQYGFPGTAYAIIDAIGGSSRATLAQLQAAEAYSGWSVGAHAYTQADHDTNFANLTTTALDDDLYQMKQFLLANGFHGADHLAYPEGAFNVAAEAVVAKYFATCRTINNTRFEAVPPSNPLRLQTQQYVTNVTSTATIEAAIDNAYTNQGWLILVFHEIVTTPSVSTQYSIANFGTVIDYLATKGIPVRTVHDVVTA